MIIHAESAEDGTLVLSLPEQFAPAHPDRFITRLAAQVAAGRVSRVRIDMTRTVLVGAEGMTILQAVGHLAMETGVAVTAVVPGVDLRRLLGAFGLDQLMQLATTWPEEVEEVP